MKLSEKAKKAKAAYQKAWATKNREKTRQYFVNYWERKATELENGPVTDTLKDSVTSVTDDSVTTCLNCGEPFASKRKTARYCSDSCRVAYNRKK